MFSVLFATLPFGSYAAPSSSHGHLDRSDQPYRHIDRRSAPAQPRVITSGHLARRSRYPSGIDTADIRAKLALDRRSVTLSRRSPINRMSAGVYRGVEKWINTTFSNNRKDILTILKHGVPPIVGSTTSAQFKKLGDPELKYARL